MDQKSHFSGRTLSNLQIYNPHVTYLGELCLRATVMETYYSNGSFCSLSNGIAGHGKVKRFKSTKSTHGGNLLSFLPPANETAGRLCFYRHVSVHRGDGYVQRGGYVQGVGTHPTLDIGPGRGVLTPRTDT